MKLTIDINETYFKQFQTELKNSPEYPNLDYCQIIIASGTPYEERPHGEWKETGYETGALGITYRQTQCSNCGWEHALPMWLNFCPNCGAEMRRGDTNDDSL